MDILDFSRERQLIYALKRDCAATVMLRRGFFQVVPNFKRTYRVLALESSCDDSCVALLEKKAGIKVPTVIDEMKLTLNSAPMGGIVPTMAHEFHLQNLPNLVKAFCSKHKVTTERPPDLICVTRGPGMMGSLSSSLQLAKGLAVAWNVPLVGVHHMLGHLLTANMSHTETPTYPYLSLLCSGGHTMLVFLRSLTDHEIIIDTSDIAAGDSIDKCARELGLQGNMLGPRLEQYVDQIDRTTQERFRKVKTDRDNEFGLRLKMPLRAAKHKKIPDVIEFSFASFLSSVSAFKRERSLTELELKFAAFKVQDMIFDHIIDRINIAFLKHSGDRKFNDVKDFVCSGGVGANTVLRHKLQTQLNSPAKLKYHFPEPALCTDNAKMIGNAGIEIFEQLRLRSDLSILPIRKWPVDNLLGVDGWVLLSDQEFEQVTKGRIS